MTEPLSSAILSATALAGLGMMTAAGLSGWRGWLALQAQGLMRTDPTQRHDDVSGAPPAGARIELADLKERVRKLEAIAAGIDL
jgi:hypothetical protein